MGLKLQKSANVNVLMFGRNVFKVPQVLKWITFPEKISSILPFWYLRNVEYF